MLVPIPGRRNWIAYYLWSWLCRSNGKFCAELDRYFFGPSHGVNDYEELASQYKKSNVKPDKQYSILPTVLKMIGDCSGKICTDLGCGGGFFTVALAEAGACRVYGLDNSESQLRLACRFSSHPAVSYVVYDVFVDNIKPTDIVIAPFVANYARTKPILRHFFRQLYECLKEGGKAALVVDLPNGRELKRFGAVKKIKGVARDESPIEINLFNDDTPICKLWAVYYTRETIESLLAEVGFRNITWQKPVISEEGIKALRSSFWEGYLDDPELGYIVMEK